LSTAEPAAAARISWAMSLTIFVAVVMLALPQAALLPLLDRDEPRFAEASREMWQSGNYIVPTFNHEPRYAKPPLIYWCQVAAFRLCGESAFAARLPSLLATAATAVVLYTWGARLGAGQAGLGASLSYAFCFQVIQQGRVATADALLIFFMTLTAFAGWKIIRPIGARAGWPCYVALALGFGLGFLAKGPEAWLPLVPLLWCARRASRSVMIGIVLSFLAGVLITLAWAIPAYVETGGEYWRSGLSQGIGQRAFVGLQGHGASNFGGYIVALPYYFLLFWISALPWSALILARMRQLIVGWKPDLADTYLLLNAALIFLVFTLMVTKLPHYTLPAFPLLALVLIRRWHAVRVAPGMFTELGWITGVALALIALIGLPIALAHQQTPSPVGDLVRAAGDNLEPGTDFALVDFNEPNAIWEMRGETVAYAQFIPEPHVRAFLDQSGPHAVVLTTAKWQQLALTPDPAWKIFQARGLNAAKLRPLDLTLVVKP
jgi:4-amino-4-deoxy-L-arabinose transferase-like glycosyltransferase